MSVKIWNKVTQLLGGAPQPEEGHDHVGLHRVRDVLFSSDQERLLLADFKGRTDKPVFIKEYITLARCRESDPQFADQVAAELVQASALRNKMLYRLLDFGVKGPVYLVFEAIPRHTLQELIEHSSLPAAEAVALVQQLLRLAQELQIKGVKMGELTPSEVWLTPTREPRLITGQWVLDFAARRWAEKMTAANSDVAKGSPEDVDYLAPEVLRGEEIDFATAQYILGAILFRLLTGESVVGKDVKVVDRVVRIIGTPPPKASSMDPTLGTGFDEILDRLLSKEPGQRYPSFADVISLLQKALQTTN